MVDVEIDFGSDVESKRGDFNEESKVVVTKNSEKEIDFGTDVESESDDFNEESKVVVMRKSEKDGRCQCQQVRITIASIMIMLGACFGIVMFSINKSVFHSTTKQQLLEEPRLFEINEQIDWACSEKSLSRSMEECRLLCQGKSCCFKDEQSSCKGQEGLDCAIYAECEVLFVLWMGSE